MGWGREICFVGGGGRMGCCGGGGAWDFGPVRFLRCPIRRLHPFAQRWDGRVRRVGGGGRGWSDGEGAG